MPKHGSIILYVHGNQKARSDGQLRTCTSTLTQLLNYEPCTSLQCHFIRSHGIRRVHVCIAVTCHLPLWNDRDLLLADAVTRGWNGYRNMSQHRGLTQEKKILPPLLPGIEPETFRSDHESGTLTIKQKHYITLAVVSLSIKPVSYTHLTLPTMAVV